jgi:hypothetical protein
MCDDPFSGGVGPAEEGAAEGEEQAEHDIAPIADMELTNELTNVKVTSQAALTVTP